LLTPGTLKTGYCLQYPILNDTFVIGYGL